MNYETSQSETSQDVEIPFLIEPDEERQHVILFHLLAVEENGREHWIQNEFAFDSLYDIEMSRTLEHLRTLEQEGTVQNIKMIERTATQEWLF